MGHGPELLDEALAAALSGHRCVSAWLGYGNALFLGFGSEVVSPRNPDGRRTVPPYELQTSMAADSDDERESAERAVEALVGRVVVRWQLKDHHGLEVEFAGGWLLEVIPPSEIDPDWSDLDEWWFCLPGSRFVGVGSDGRVVAGWSDRPKGSHNSEPDAATDQPRE